MRFSPSIRPGAISATSLLLALSVGCGGGDSVTGSGTDGGSTSGATVASVTVTPADDSAFSIDETVAFSAAAKDAGGKTVSGVSFSWSSLDGSVASVSSAGVATARGDGTARIVASAGGKADTARLVVEQRTASVSVSPDSARLEAVGDTVRFTGSALDARGHAVPGVALSWSVSDPGVAEVDGQGLVTALAIGRVEVFASVAGDTGRAVLRVSTLAVPQVQSVVPTPLREGQGATITGRDFASTAAGDSVYVDGVAAVVTSASATTLAITVPTFDCLPARDVSVRVATTGGSSELASPLEPDETPVSVGVGQQAVLTDPANFCLQFDASSASERYLVGVQSLSGAVDALTPVTLVAEAADGSGAALVAPRPLASRAVPVAGGGISVERPRWLERQRDAEAGLRRWERRRLDPGASLPALRSGGAGPAITPLVGGSTAVGDTVELRVPDDRTSDLCQNYLPVTGTVEAIGSEAIIVADTANPANGFTQADYQDFSDRLDTEIFATDEAYFGSPGDLDGNGHIVVLFSKAVNLSSPDALGFAWAGDLFPRTACAASDEGEVFYGKAPDPNGDYGDPFATSTALSQEPFVMAHELVHVIQLGRRFADGHSFMSPELAEGQATLGEEVVGHAVTGRQPYQDYGIDVALNLSGTDEIDWYADGFYDLLGYFGFESSTTRVDGAPEQCGWWRADPSPCRARPLWYGVSWSFLRWLSDRYGPSYPGGEQGLQQALVSDAATGLPAASDVVGVPLGTLLARWSAALYVDGRIPGPDPSLTISSWDLFDVEQNTVATAHLQPAEMSFSDWQLAGDVRSSSAGYVALDGSGRPATALRIRGGAGGTLPSSMQVWVVRLR